MKFEFKQPSDFWEKMFRYVCGSPNWGVFDERSKVSLTYGTYIKLMSRIKISLKYYNFSYYNFNL